MLPGFHSSRFSMKGPEPMTVFTCSKASMLAAVVGAGVAADLLDHELGTGQMPQRSDRDTGRGRKAADRERCARRRPGKCADGRGVGFLGLATLAGLLWAARGRAPYAVIAAAGWTALLLHSLIDHLLEFAPVVLAAGLLLGWAATTARSEQLDVPEGEPPVLR